MALESFAYLAVRELERPARLSRLWILIGRCWAAFPIITLYCLYHHSLSLIFLSSQPIGLPNLSIATSWLAEHTNRNQSVS